MAQFGGVDIVFKSQGFILGSIPVLVEGHSQGVIGGGIARKLFFDRIERVLKGCRCLKKKIGRSL